MQHEKKNVLDVNLTAPKNLISQLNQQRKANFARAKKKIESKFKILVFNYNFIYRLETSFFSIK